MKSVHEEFIHSNILRTIKRRKTDWIGDILRRNYCIWHVLEGHIKGSIGVKGRQGRICKLLLDDLKETRGCWKFKEGTLDRTVCMTRPGRSEGSVIIRWKKLIRSDRVQEKSLENRWWSWPVTQWRGVRELYPELLDCMVFWIIQRVSCDTAWRRACTFPALRNFTFLLLLFLC